MSLLSLLTAYRGGSDGGSNGIHHRRHRRRGHFGSLRSRRHVGGWHDRGIGHLNNVYVCI